MSLTITRFAAVDVVKINVGLEEVSFIVHRRRLCDTSGFFRAAFTSQFKEGQSQSMDLPEDNPHVFDCFMQWLYKHNYTVPEWPKEDDPEEGEWPFLMSTIQLLSFSDKYDIPSLKKCILDAMKAYSLQDRRIRPPSLRAIRYAYDNSHRNSGIRKLLAQWYAHLKDDNWADSDYARQWLMNVPEFAIDLIAILDKFPKPCRVRTFFRDMDTTHYMEDVKESTKRPTPESTATSNGRKGIMEEVD